MGYHGPRDRSGILLLHTSLPYVLLNYYYFFSRSLLQRCIFNLNFLCGSAPLLHRDLCPPDTLDSLGVVLRMEENMAFGVGLVLLCRLLPHVTSITDINRISLREAPSRDDRTFLVYRA